MFDTKEELAAQIRLGEDSRLELKAVTFRGDRVTGPHPDGLADEIAAFANSEAYIFTKVQTVIFIELAAANEKCPRIILFGWVNSAARRE